MESGNRVAVVIPTYNPTAHFRDALDSVRHQTFRDLHIYVVDDGSNEIPPIPAAPDLTFVTRENAGVSRTRNFAASLGREPLIAFLDQDDSWHRDKLARQVDLLSADPGAAGCFTWAQSIDSEGRVTGDAYGAYDHDVVDGRAFGGGVILSSLILRRSAFLEAGGFDPALRIVQDWDLLIRASLIGPVLACRERLTRYRVHGGNTSRDYRRLGLEAKNLLQRLAPMLPDEDRGRVLEARRDFERLVADKARDAAREAARDRRVGEALGSAVWGIGRSMAAASLAARAHRVARR